MQESPNRRFWLDKVEAALSRLVTSHSLPKSDVQALYSLYEDLVQRESFHSWNSVREDCDTWLRLNNPKSELFKPQHAFWDGLVSLISTDWYQRVWTHQEGLLASEAMLLLPRASVRYRPVEQLVWIAAGVRRSTEPPSELDMRNTRVLMDALLGLRLNNRDAGSALGIHIVMTRRRRASSQRDLVYGLLGLMKEPVRREINVDYTLPLATVFVQATYAAVMEHPRMLPFMWESFSHTMTTNSELPSWCPDFENRSYSAPFGIELPKVSDSVTEKYKDFAKATYADPVPTLSFSAWRLDTVLNSVGRIDRSVAANLSSTPTNQENSDADLVATTFRAVVELTSWLHAFDNTFPWEVSEDSIAKLQRILKFVVLIDQHLPGQREAFYDQRDFGETLSTSEDIIVLMPQCFQTFFDRVEDQNILDTASGKLGYSIMSVSPGDCIVYAPGGDVLHVLSADKRRYRGAARVEGYVEDALEDILGGELGTFYMT